MMEVDNWKENTEEGRKQSVLEQEGEFQAEIMPDDGQC